MTKGRSDDEKRSSKGKGDIKAKPKDPDSQTKKNQSAKQKPTVEPPDDLLCPVTHSLFRDPVVNKAGNTYERAALEHFWETFGRRRLVDPLTNEALPDDGIIPNWDMRRRVQAFMDQHPSYVPVGWPDRTVPAPESRSSQRNASSVSRDDAPKNFSSTRIQTIGLATAVAILGIAVKAPSILPGLVTLTSMLVLSGVASLALGLVLLCMGWGEEGALKKLTAELGFLSGVTMLAIGVFAWIVPDVAMNPLTLSGAASLTLGVVLLDVGWETELESKSAATKFAFYAGLTLLVLFGGVTTVALTKPYSLLQTA